MSIEGKQVLAVIPARGGSKGLPGKNISEVGGKPLIAWSIEAATKSKYIDRAVISSDDEDIIAAAKDYDGDVPFKRPAELAQDDSSIYDVLFHAVDTVGGVWDYIVLLQPTSPLRSTADIDNCIELCHNTDGEAAVVSVTEPGKSPYWFFSLTGEKNTMKPLFPKQASTDRRQKLPKAYHLNGAVYVARLYILRREKSFISQNTQGYIMAPERSLDVDNQIDLTFVRAVVDSR